MDDLRTVGDLADVVIGARIAGLTDELAERKLAEVLTHRGGAVLSGGWIAVAATERSGGVGLMVVELLDPWESLRTPLPVVRRPLTIEHIQLSQQALAAFEEQRRLGQV